MDKDEIGNANRYARVGSYIGQFIRLSPEAQDRVLERFSAPTDRRADGTMNAAWRRHLFLKFFYNHDTTEDLVFAVEEESKNG